MAEDTILLLDGYRSNTETNESAAVQKHLSQRDVHLGPARILPFDILIEIFRHCTLSEGVNKIDMRRGGSVNTARAPWNLSQVCRKWRKVTLFGATLWSELHLFLGEAFVPGFLVHMPQILALTRIQLIRSGGSPLNVYISTSPGASVDDYARMISKLTDLLSHHSCRFQELIVRSDRVVLVECLEKSFNNSSFPLLRHLEVSLDNNFNNSGVSSALFSSSTSLLAAKFSDWLPTKPTFPWGQLTHLTASSAEERALYNVLPLLFSLTSLSLLYGFFVVGQGFTPPQPITLPLLQSLEVKGQATFALFNAPRLQHLIVDDNAILEGLSTFLLRSKCSLTSLTFTLQQYGIETILELLDCVPELTELAWEGAIDEAHLNQLVLSLQDVNDDGRLMYCPHLQTLRLDHSDPRLHTIIHPQLNDLICMVELRFRNSTLKEVDIRNIDVPASWKPMKDRLILLRAQGMNICLGMWAGRPQIVLNKYLPGYACESEIHYVDL